MQQAIDNQPNSISIKGLDKAEILAALYNNSKSQGLGYLHYQEGDMTKEEAQELLVQSSNKYFDYLKGRVMKIDLSTDTLNTFLYNRDLGNGAAEGVIKSLKDGKDGKDEEARSSRVEKKVSNFQYQILGEKEEIKNDLKDLTELDNMWMYQNLDGIHKYPDLKSGYVVVAEFDQVVKKTMVLCPNKESMNQIYKQYSTGMAVNLTWYSAKYEPTLKVSSFDWE